MGVVDFVAKPFNSAELLARVRAHYQMNQLRDLAVDAARGRAVVWSQFARALAVVDLAGAAVGTGTIVVGRDIAHAKFKEIIDDDLARAFAFMRGGDMRGTDDAPRDPADALAACADAIDALKAEVPLWKKELYADGEEWIGRGS
jgi:hypothetical protein